MISFRLWSSLLLSISILFGAQTSMAACDVYSDGFMLDIECDGDDDLVDVVVLDGNLFVDTTNDDVIDLIDWGPANNLTDIFINSGGGNDKVIVIGLDIAGSVDVKTELGEDRIFAGSSVVENNFKIKMGDDADLATLLGVDVGNNVDVKTGNGEDTVQVLLFPVGDFPFEFVGIRAGNEITIKGGKGYDELTGVEEIDADNRLVIKSFESIE